MRNVAATTAVVWVLAACGGGGTNSPASTTQNTNTSQSTNTSLPATSTVNGTSSPSGTAANTLVGSNGDLGKYVGTWKSGCEVRGSSAAAASTSASDSTTSTTSGNASSVIYYYGITSIDFLSVSGNTLAGQSTVQSYEDSACAKPMSNPNDGTVAITLAYQGNTTLAPNATYSGSADNVSISVAGETSPSTGYMAFDPGYGKLYTNQSTTFDNDSFVFTKQ